MRFEGNRLQSFHLDRGNINVCRALLAETGFYFIGPGDRVKCFFCKVEILNWSLGDDEVWEHYRYQATCPLLTQQLTDNVPIDEGNFFFKQFCYLFS